MNPDGGITCDFRVWFTYVFETLTGLWPKAETEMN